MTKTKRKKTILDVFFESLKIYFKNFKIFLKYMTFPVLGQVLGIVISILGTFIYVKNLPQLIERFPTFTSISTVLITAIVIAIPGIIIFSKALWEYLIVYGAINSMIDNYSKSGKIYDIKAHIQTVTQKTPIFIGLWLLYGLFLLIGSFPLFWVLFALIFVYFSLIFQVFTYKKDVSPIGCFVESYKLIKGHYWQTFGLLTFLGLFTYIIIPELIKFILTAINVIAFLAIFIEGFFTGIQIPNIPLISLTPLLIAQFVISTIIASIIIGYLLPLRCICCALWYKTLEK